MIHVVDQHPELLIPERPGAHVWVMMVALRLSAEEIEAHVASGANLRLDTSRAAWAEIGCYVCENPYTPERATQPCPAAFIHFSPGQVNIR